MQSLANWFDYLRRGLARTLPDDRLTGRQGYAPAGASLRNLRPFLKRHWRKGVLGVALVLLTSLLGLLPPLINRYLVDDVILARQVQRLLWAALAFAAVKGLGMLAGAIEQFAFTRFEQEMLLDIQGQLLERTLRLPKSFFDSQEVGYLMSRLTSDVGGLRWFFSSTLVHLASDALRFVGGVAFLFYLEWRLALVALVVLPALVVGVRMFTRRSRILSHQAMERQANVSRRVQESLSTASLIKAFAAEERTVGQIMSELRAAFQVTLENLVVGSAANLVLQALSDIGAQGGAGGGGVPGHPRPAGRWGRCWPSSHTWATCMARPSRLATANLQLQQRAGGAGAGVGAVRHRSRREPGGGPAGRAPAGRGRVPRRLFFLRRRRAGARGRVVPHPAGERVAIVGPSGVGKTTLVSLILRFYKPTAGEIWFDGVPAADYELGSLRRRIGYVSQSTLLLVGDDRRQPALRQPRGKPRSR